MNEVYKRGPAPTGAVCHGPGRAAAQPGRILVHMCCGPCSIVPLKSVLAGRAEVWGFFHNPNIHPRSEFLLRLASVKKLASLLSLDVICDEEYNAKDFIEGLKLSSGDRTASQAHPPHGERCAYCYSTRMEATAKAAAQNGFDAFTSSLLYSRYQAHDEIKALGAGLAQRYGVSFYYDDFRPGWQDGIDASKEMGLYRQKYCGCIYSRKERYAKKYGMK